MTTYKFMFLLHFLSDLFGKINILSKSLQKRYLSYKDVKKLVDTFLSSVEAEYLGDKPAFGPLCAEFLQATSDSDVNSYHGIEFSRHHLDSHLQSQAVQCATVIHQNISDRFPDNELFEAFTVFELSNFPANVTDLPRYGEVAIDHLANHYTFIDKDALNREWGVAKYMIYNNYKGLSASELLIELTPSKDQFPSVIRLLEISQVLPVSSVECERGFSRQNLIKTRL